MKILIKNVRAIDPQVNLDEVCDILVENNRIAQVAPSIECNAEDASEELVVLDRSGHIAFPGLVDIHVHLRDPGYEYKETIATGTRAASHGGFTDICSMPNTDPCTDTGVVIDYVRNQAREAGYCTLHPSGACTKGLKGEQLSEIGDMVAHGAVAFTDDGRGVQNSGMMRRVMDYVKMFNVPVMSHCQDEAFVGPGQVNEGPVSTKLGVAPWPACGEELQIARDIAISELTGCPIHIQHITTKRGVELVKEGKERGIAVSAEATPHHLVLTDDLLLENYDTNLKMNPPLRSKEDTEALIDAIKTGVVDCIVTDHAPHAAHEKDREFELAPFGMTGIETSVGVVLTYLVAKGHIDYSKMVELMAINPRRILNLEPVQLAKGSSANITIINPCETWTVTEDDMLSKSKNCGFLGYELTGRATDVICNGVQTMKEGNVID